MPFTWWMLTGCLWVSIGAVWRWWRWAFQHFANWLARQFILFMKTFLHFYDVHSAFTTVPLSLGRLHSELFMLQFMLRFRCERDREPWNCDKSQQPRWLSIWTHFHSIFHSKFLEGNSIHINEWNSFRFPLEWWLYAIVEILHCNTFCAPFSGHFFSMFSGREFFNLFMRI